MADALGTAFKIRREKDKSMHVGPIVSAVPGRTDDHPMKVPSGAYVVNADTVSHLGENNTLAGLAKLEKMFGSKGGYRSVFGPGSKYEVSGKPKRARGGGVDIMAAGGEYVITPEVVANIGGGDLERGHRMLDKWMIDQRKHHIKTLQNLPGPAKA